jgi:hypothetical protein
MTALIGVVVAAASLATPLPPLPAEGLVLDAPSGITFVDLRGRRLGHVDGLRFTREYALNSGVPRFRDRQGRLWSLDVRGHRLIPAVGGLPLARGATLLFARRARAWLVLRRGRIALRMPVGREFPFLSEDRDVVSTGRRALDLRTLRFVRVPHGCIVASRRSVHWVLLCGRIEHGTVLPTTVEELVGGRRRRLTGPGAVVERGPAGYWIYVRVARDRRTLLVQWSGECESPTAFLLTPDRRLRPVGAPTRRAGPESRAMGWSPSGRPVVSFPGGICGSGYRGGPGVYSIAPDGTPSLIVRTKPRQQVAFWG